MSESHSNRSDQMGTALLVVVLFGLLLMGAGAVGWFYVRAERARRIERARHEAEAQRHRAEAELADRTMIDEQADESSPAQAP